MVIRLQFARGLRVKKKQRKNQHVALALATLLSPVKVGAFALGGWRLASDLGIAGQFAVSQGLFSHWQVWMVIGGMVQVLAMALNRYGNSEPILPNSEQKTQSTILDSGY